MSREWYYTKDGKSKVGPISGAELQLLAKSGQLAPTDMIWKEGMPKWSAASSIKGLFTRLEVTPPAGSEFDDTARLQVKARPAPMRDVEIDLPEPLLMADDFEEGGRVQA